MEIISRYPVVAALKVPGIDEKAAQILKAVRGLEVDTAISLLEWCSRALLQQKCEITPEFLQVIINSKAGEEE